MSTKGYFVGVAIAFGTILLAGCGRSGEPTASAVFQSEALESLEQLCREIGSIPHSENAMQALDLNGDGRNEHVLFAGWIYCENSAGLYGDREKYVVAYSDLGEIIYEGNVYDIKIERLTDHAELWLTVSGSGCGTEADAPTFAEEVFCERSVIPGPDGYLVYAPVDTIRLIQ